MTITIVGHGYVGLVTACIFADLGNTVYVIGRDDDKLNKLKNGDPIIFEPGLSELLKKNLSAKRILFTTSYENSIAESEIVFIAVGTPPKENGEADLSNVLNVAEKIGRHLKKPYTVISCKSTVPVGTNRKIAELIKACKPPSTKFDVASCPEFLREGSAIRDSFSPDRIVLGSDSKKALSVLLKLHKPLDGERVTVGLESAEIIKYAANSFLATKISFANLIAFYCEKTGANVEDVLRGVGIDKRIGMMFFNPGVGYGGSCFPKDVKALIKTGEQLDLDVTLLKAVEDINMTSKNNFIKKIKKNAPHKKICIWGIAFKPNTDDIRDAPAIAIMKDLLESGFSIKAYDPEATTNARKIFKKKIEFCTNPYEAVKDASCLVIITEWNEFKQINLQKIFKTMKKPIIIDGRNIYDPQTLNKMGFTYISIGR